ncbi:ZIP family metal transporter [Candidatus Pacearchaeota archaeon]|nr:ZIP family metal transporter [Candidatus Pacearchaeota archaeon]
MNNLFYIILATLIVSLISFIGILSLAIRERLLEKILLSLVALSAGALIGGAFLHLIPEAVEKTKSVFVLVLIGFVIFFLIEKVLHWQHCHEGKCEIHTFAYMNLVGDFFHNFLDGLIIAASFILDFKLGIITTFAIAIHEIPQEIGDFGVLVYGGFSRKRAVFMNFISALAAVLGGIFGYFLSSYSNIPMSFIPPIAAGGFIYIAASDLIPELRKENTRMSIVHFFVFILGIAIMYGLKFLGVD